MSEVFTVAALGMFSGADNEERSSQINRVSNRAIEGLRWAGGANEVAQNHYLKLQSEFVVDRVQFVIPANSKSEIGTNDHSSLSTTNSQAK